VPQWNPVSRPVLRSLRSMRKIRGTSCWTGPGSSFLILLCTFWASIERIIAFGPRASHPCGLPILWSCRRESHRTQRRKLGTLLQPMNIFQPCQSSLPFNFHTAIQPAQLSSGFNLSVSTVMFLSGLSVGIFHKFFIASTRTGCEDVSHLQPGGSG
jgi:hypothetical protein